MRMKDALHKLMQVPIELGSAESEAKEFACCNVRGPGDCPEPDSSDQNKVRKREVSFKHTEGFDSACFLFQVPDTSSQKFF